jgi:hypothetical protein
MPKLTRLVTARLSVEEFDIFKSRAADNGTTASALLRKLIVSPSGPEYSSFDHCLMSEVLALRAITINLLYQIATHSAITPGTIAALIKQADNDKATRADNRLQK